MLEMDIQKKHKILVITLIIIILLLLIGMGVLIIKFSNVKKENANNTNQIESKEEPQKEVNIYKEDNNTVESITYPALSEEDAKGKVERYYKDIADPSIIDVFYGSHIDLDYKNTKKIDNISYIVTNIDFKAFKSEVLKFVTEEKYQEKNIKNKEKFEWTKEIDGKVAVAAYGASGSTIHEILDMKLNYLGNGEYSCDVVGTWGYHSQIVKANVKFKYYNNSYVIYETSGLKIENFNPYIMSEYCINLINITGKTAIDLAYNEPFVSENSKNSYDYTGEILSKGFKDTSGEQVTEFDRQYKIVNISYKSLIAFAKKYVTQEVFEKLVNYTIQNFNGKTGVVIESSNFLGRMVKTQGYELVKMEGDKYTYHVNLNNGMVNFGATFVIEKVDDKYIVTSFEEEHVS